MEEDVARIPKPLAPAENGGKVTDAQYIKDGEHTQHEINEQTIKGDVPQDDGMYVRKNGVWSKLEIRYDDEAEALIINTQSANE